VKNSFEDFPYPSYEIDASIPGRAAYEHSKMQWPIDNFKSDYK